MKAEDGILNGLVFRWLVDAINHKDLGRTSSSFYFETEAIHNSEYRMNGIAVLRIIGSKMEIVCSRNSGFIQDRYCQIPAQPPRKIISRGINCDGLAIVNAPLR